MNICRSLIEAASKASGLLGSRRDHVIRILLERQLADGGFGGKGKTSDLYYTGFAVLSLMALNADFDRSPVIGYLEDYKFAETTDLAHRSAWIRLLKLLKPNFPDDAARAVCTEMLVQCRSDDGAWHHLGREKTGSAYGCFLFLGACQDLDLSVDIETRAAIGRCLDLLETPGGGYFNERSIPACAVPSTAAAMIVREVLGGTEQRVAASAQWLLKNYTGDGFQVMLMAPVSDLLSTAVALHALAQSGVPLSALRLPCLKYVNSLWDPQIGFCANSLDRLSDTEYMFYGLLALGHLSE